MNEQMIRWCAIVGILLCIFITRCLVWYFSHPNRKARHSHLIEIGKEREIFFVPGDEEDDDDF
ncbi:MAG: hypothetical protein K2F86_06605 [Duncaniella sp.]|nr:hypothetical protein [Duncaniella sp.]MDE6178820.1 hypothetical protein [Duncaniella sp.]